MAVDPSCVVWTLNPAGRFAPLLPAPIVVSTQGNRSFWQPVGYRGVALVMSQSSCCHIWKKRCTGLDRYVSYTAYFVISTTPFASGFGNRGSTSCAGRPLDPVVSMKSEPDHSAGSKALASETLVKFALGLLWVLINGRPAYGIVF